MGNYKGGIVDHGVKKGRDGCINQNYINGIQFQPGCAVRVILNGRGDEDQRKTKIAWVEDIYTHHILFKS